MLQVALALLLTASAPPAQQARTLASAGSWEELYLAFSAADPAKYSDEDRRLVAASLRKGCEALQKGDAVMAFSLGDKSVAFADSAEGLLCLARTARATDQRGAAEQALRKGLSAFPEKAGAFGLLLGQQLLEDRDPSGAQEALGRVPKRAKEHGPAQALLKKARAELSEERAARQQAREVERRLERGAPAAGDTRQLPAQVEVARAEGRGKTTSTSLSYESGEGPGGMRTRSNSRFTFKYFNNNRDFGERAEYEGHIVEAMDEAYEASQRILGVVRSAPVDVVLYTREEFAAHFSARTAQRVAGLYSMDSIRINGAAELTRENRATLVHEYVHAVLDDFTGGQGSRLPLWLNEGLAEYIEWRYLGSDGPFQHVQGSLRGAAKANQLPQLAQMDRGAPINQGDPAVAYGFSAIAVRVLVKDGGTAQLLELIKAVGQGQPFEQALSERYGRSLARLQEQARDDLL